jgi:hypothetical protein
VKRLVSFLSLFTSVGTLVCCALPALFVVLGFGAAFAGIVGNVPQLIWISEHKTLVFGTGAVLLTLGGALQWRAKQMECPIDPQLGEACRTTRDWSVWVYLASVAIYLLGAGFAFLPELLAGS